MFIYLSFNNPAGPRIGKGGAHIADTVLHKYLHMRYREIENARDIGKYRCRDRQRYSKI